MFENVSFPMNLSEMVIKRYERNITIVLPPRPGLTYPLPPPSPQVFPFSDYSLYRRIDPDQLRGENKIQYNI